MKKLLFAIAVLFCLSSHGQNKEAYLLVGSHFHPTDTKDFDRDFKFNGFNINGQWPINYSNPGSINPPSSKRNFLLSRGSITAGYNVRKGRHTIGGMFLYEKQRLSRKTNLFSGVTINVEENETTTNGEFVLTELLPWSDSNMNNYHLALRYDYNWVSKEKLKLYSGLSLGVSMRYANTLYYRADQIKHQFEDEIPESFYREKNTDYLYHLHINGIGIRYGTVWAVVAELGLGHRGYVNVGVNHLLFASEKWEAKRKAKENL